MMLLLGVAVGVGRLPLLVFAKYVFPEEHLEKLLHLQEIDSK